MCGRFGLVEMAPKELWKAKVGFQKQKLIALHLAFQCPVALSYTRAEWKPLPRQGAWGRVRGQGFRAEGGPWRWVGKTIPLATRDTACLPGFSAQVGAGQGGGRSSALSLGSPGDGLGLGVGPILPPQLGDLASFLPRSESQSGPLYLTILRGHLRLWHSVISLIPQGPGSHHEGRSGHLTHLSEGKTEG